MGVIHSPPMWQVTISVSGNGNAKARSEIAVKNILGMQSMYRDVQSGVVVFACAAHSVQTGQHYVMIY